jgi:transposase
MTPSYLPYEPRQQQLLPSALQDWLPEGHLAYDINDVIDSLDLSAFHARHMGGGPRNQPYHPAMMVKVLVYGYATGVFSSRKIARKLHEDVAFRVLGAGNFPAHRTICDFRALHLKELAARYSRFGQGPGRVEIRLRGVEPAADGNDEGSVEPQNRQANRPAAPCKRLATLATLTPGPSPAGAGEGSLLPAAENRAAAPTPRPPAGRRPDPGAGPRRPGRPA